MNMKAIDLDLISEKKKNVIITTFLSAWLLVTIYFQEIISLL